MILNDKEITQRCLNSPFPMIEPFDPRLIRAIGEVKVISHGLSSFGYDVKLDRDVKIFHNLKGGVVDPKRFDQERLLIDAEVFMDEDHSEYVILPPNSYLLGRTDEYFKIPRNIQVICLGKCLTGDTLISNAETGEILPMRETEHYKQVNSLNLDNQTISGYVTEGLINNGIQKVSELKTRLGFSIKATGTHPFLTWNGWKALDDLKPGDRIAVARREPLVGRISLTTDEAHLLGYMTANGQCDTPGHSPTFTSYDPVIMTGFIKSAEAHGFTITDKENGAVRLVNRKGRGGVPIKNRASIWLESHGVNVKSRHKQVPKVIQMGNEQAICDYLSALMSCDGGFSFKESSSVVLEYYTTSKLLAEHVHILLKRLGLFFTKSSVLKNFNGEMHDCYIIRSTCADTVRKFIDIVGFIPGSKKHLDTVQWLKLNIVKRKSNYDTLPPEAWSTVSALVNRHGKTCGELGVHINKQSVSRKVVYDLAKILNDSDLLTIALQDVVWDTVKEISDAGEAEVFDYTVPAYSNFVANGVVVHNSTYARCGALVNCTPIEAGFEGRVVIEIANGTSSPMRVYVREGIAQFLFLEGNACQTSYADRNGKYQGQTGVQLPLV